MYLDGAFLCTAHPSDQLTAEQEEAFRAHGRAESRRLGAQRRKAAARARIELAPLTGEGPAEQSRLQPPGARLPRTGHGRDEVLARKARTSLLGLPGRPTPDTYRRFRQRPWQRSRGRYGRRRGGMRTPMPRHFTNLTGATTLKTGQFALAHRIVADLVDNLATGVIHGSAGTGKTFAVESALEDLRAGHGPHGEDRGQVLTNTLAFTSKPTMKLVADELVKAITGSAPRNRSRFYLTAMLIELLTGTPRLVVIDEAQRLNGDCIELIRHLHDHPDTRFALLYVGGDGCWEVLSREPMLRSRVFRRLPFKPIKREDIATLISAFHPIYTGVAAELLTDIDDTYAHGTLRDWAAFTHTAADLCREAGRACVDAEIVANAYAMLGGGLT